MIFADSTSLANRLTGLGPSRTGVYQHSRVKTRTSATCATLLTIALLGACSTGGKSARTGTDNPQAGSGTFTPASPVSTDTLSPTLSPQQKKEQEKLLHRKLIGQMMEQGSWYAALAHCDAYDKQWGADTASRLLRSDAQRMTGQLAAAEAGYRALRETALKPQALHGLSQIAAQRGQWVDASTLLTEAIRQSPLNARLYNDQGLVLLLLNRPQDAFTSLRKSQELEPDKNLARANLALYAAVYSEDALFSSLSQELNWKRTEIDAVRAQASRIRAAHRAGQPPSPDIFAGR